MNANRYGALTFYGMESWNPDRCRATRQGTLVAAPTRFYDVETGARRTGLLDE